MSFTESVPEIVRANSNGLLAKHSSWRRVALRDVFDVQNGFPFESKYFNDRGDGMPLLRIRDIVSGATETFYSGPYEDAFVVKPGDIVVGMDGDFNVRPWRGPEALLNQRVCRLVPRGGYLGELLPLVLQGYLDAINASTSAITVKHLSSRTVEEIPLPLPPAGEQGRLLEMLEGEMSCLEAAGASLERGRARLKAYRASVLKAAVEGRLVPTEAELARKQKRDYQPASVLLDRILKERRRRWEEAELARLRKAGKAPKDNKWKAKYVQPGAPGIAKLPPLPEGWCWASAAAFYWDAGYGTSEKCSETADGPPVLRIPNVVNGQVSLNDLKFCLRPSALAADGALAPGDFLFIRTNGSRSLIGKGALVDSKYLRPHFFASYLIRLRLVDIESIASWFSLSWHGPVLRGQLLEVAASSAGQHNVSLSSASEFAVALPPAAEQVRVLMEVARLSSAADAVERELPKSVHRVTRLRSAILKWAFEGKLLDQDPADEPAEELLTRIRAERAVTTLTKKPKSRKERIAR